MSDPRSLAGHAAVAIKGTGNEWIELQSTTFLNWVNQSLISGGSQQRIEDLTNDFSDGVKLVALVEALQQRKLPKIKANPFNQHQMMENVTIALKALADDNVKLVNIGCEDIVAKNDKLILGLIWHLILKYQIGKTSRIPPKKLMLAWMQSVIPECTINNFTTDWNSGIALHALVDYCRPGLSADWKKLNASNGLENCRSGMNIAQERLDIPMILQPEDLNSPRLDELSGMTYLSYFLKNDSPGYHALLRWANDRLVPKGRQVTDFTHSWQDGRCINELVGVVFGEEPQMGATPKENVEFAYDMSRRHGVEPFLTAEEVTVNEDHIGMMAYVAKLQNASPAANGYLHAVDKVDFVDAAPPAADLSIVDTGTGMSSDQEGQVSKVCIAMLQCGVPVSDKSAVRAEVLAPSGAVLQPSVSWNSDDCAEIRFTPQEAGNHVIHVHGLPGILDDKTCAVHVKRGDLSLVKVDLPEGLRLGQPAEVRVDARQCGPGELRAELFSPSGRQSEPPVQENNVAFYTLRIIPNEPGDWYLHVWLDDQVLPGSPFCLSLISTGDVRVVAPSAGSTRETAALTVDLSAAGSAELAASVTCEGREVPCRVGDRDPVSGRVHVEFTPEEPGLYLVHMTYAGEEVRGAPFPVPVADVNRVHCSGDGLRLVQVGDDAKFVVHTGAAGPGELLIRITGPDGETVPNITRQPSEGNHSIEFTPVQVGSHKVEIQYSEQHISGSPFDVFVFDPSRAHLRHEDNMFVNDEGHFTVDLSHAGRGPLSVQVLSPSGSELRTRESSEGALRHFYFTPDHTGQHLVQVRLGDISIPGAPFHLQVQTTEVVSAHGKGLQRAEEGQTAYFIVDPKGQKGQLNVQVDGPNSIAKCNIEPEKDGRYRVSYVPVEVGRYDVHVKWNEAPVPGSPFTPCVVSPRQIHCLTEPNLTEVSGEKIPLKVGQSKRLVFSTVNAGPGVFTSEVAGPTGLLPVTMEASEEQTTLQFTPEVQGEHVLRLWWGEIPLPLSPFSGFAEPATLPVDHSKVILSGRGIKEARVQEESEFIIDGSQSGPGRPAVALRNANTNVQVDIRTTSIGADRYRCSYLPTVAGAYLLDIMWSERQVRGSPFKVSVSAMSDAGRVVCSGEGLRQGIIGQEIKSLLDTRRAGPGELTATCQGPQKVAYCELYDHRDGTYTLNIKPQEPGRHILQVKYSGEQVTGSPFVLRVSAAPDASKVRVYGPGVENGVLSKYQSKFLCETRGAGAGQLTVRIRGPKGAFRVEMQRESQKDRTITCRYDPVESGDYMVHVKWSGEHVPGSPFQVHIVDTEEELREFEARHHQAVPKGYQQWNADI